MGARRTGNVDFQLGDGLNMGLEMSFKKYRMQVVLDEYVILSAAGEKPTAEELFSRLERWCGFGREEFDEILAELSDAGILFSAYGKGLTCTSNTFLEDKADIKCLCPICGHELVAIKHGLQSGDFPKCEEFGRGGCTIMNWQFQPDVHCSGCNNSFSLGNLYSSHVPGFSSKSKWDYLDHYSDNTIIF